MVSAFSPTQAAVADDARGPATVASINQRHQAWRLRFTKVGVRDAWRPRTIYRRSAAKIVQLVHSQLSVSVGLWGLDVYLPDFKSEAWSDQRCRKLWKCIVGLFLYGSNTKYTRLVVRLLVVAIASRIHARVSASV